MSVALRTSVLPWKMRLRWAAAAIALLMAILAAFWWFAGHWAPSREDYPVQGISISSVQGEVDWRTLRTQNVDFAYIRATSGVRGRDPRFGENWAQARKAGLRYGAELVFDPCTRASEQATLFITTVPRDNAALPPVVRIGSDDGCATPPGRETLLSELNTLLNVIEVHTGKPSLIRLPEGMEERYGLTSGINRTLWMEGNFSPPRYAAHDWVMWTASDMRRIDGVEGPVEWNVVAP